jgi:hypothetical protein
VSYGGSQTYTIAGAIGSSLIKHLWIDGVEEMEATGLGYYSYTFLNVKTNHTIVAEFEEVGVKESKNSDIFIYPNPTKDKVFIRSDTRTINTIHFFDITGKLIKEFVNVNNNKIEIDLHDLKNGIYFINIDETTTKIIKQ